MLTLLERQVVSPPTPEGWGSMGSVLDRKS